MYVKYNNDYTVNKFPYTLNELYQEYPLRYFPPGMSTADLALVNVAVVVMTYAEHDPITQQAIMSGCVYNKEYDRWETTWTIVELTPEIVASNRERALASLKETVVNAVQQRLDTFAASRNYDNILSACSYASSTVEQFKNEGAYCIQARDNTWAKLYQIMSEIDSGKRPLPGGYDDIKSELPTLEWPT